MAKPSPATARVVWRASALRQRLDGRVGAETLYELEALIEDAQDADDGRLLAESLLSVGDITEWQRRRWRERHPNAPPLEAA